MDNDETKGRKDDNGQAIHVQHTPVTSECNQGMVNTTKEKGNPGGSVLTKKQRGRFKKLRKRALEVKEGCPVSGLVAKSDYDEWTGLLGAAPGDGSTNSVDNPVVRPRKKQRRNGDKDAKGACGGDESDGRTLQHQKADASDHRDILAALAAVLTGREASTNETSAASSQSQSFTTLIPPWATLHNPLSLKTLVVVELRVDADPKEDLSSVVRKIPIVNKLMTSAAPIRSKCQVFPVATRWFQGQTPKEATDSLLYSPHPKAMSNKSDKKTGGSIPASMLRLLMTETDLRQNRFPHLPEENESGDTGQTKPSLSQDVAKSLSAFATPSAPLPPLDLSRTVIKGIGIDIGTNKSYKYVSTSTLSALQQDGASTGMVFATPGPIPNRECYGLDCEMVQTTKGSALARVTLIRLTAVTDTDVRHDVVLDELVKPYDKVTDYLTRKWNSCVGCRWFYLAFLLFSLFLS